MKTGKQISILLKVVVYFLISNMIQAQSLKKADIAQVCKEVISKIDSHYVTRDKRLTISSYIENKLKAGAYFKVEHPDSLAKILTYDLRAISKDKHLYVQHLNTTTPSQDFDWDAWARQERIDEINKNFGFTELSILDGNIGYMKIVECMNPDRGFKTASAALIFLESTKGFDHRSARKWWRLWWSTGVDHCFLL